MKATVSRRCAAAPDVVFEWIRDPHKHIQMLPGSVTDAKVLENGDISAVVKAGGMTEPMVVREVECDPPRRMVGERVDGNRKGKTEFRVEPDGDGSMVTINADVDIPRLLAAVASGKIKQSLEKQLANLDRLSSQ